MELNIIKRKECRLCKSKELELALSLKPAPVRDDYLNNGQLELRQETYPLELYLCKKCGHVQMLDIINPEFLFREYNFITASSKSLVKHLQDAADSILERIKPKKSSLVVEIGSNDGSVLRYYKEKGMQVLGIDPAEDIARKATESGIETLPEFFTSVLAKEIRKEKGQASIIVANNVYAHVDNLSDMTYGVKELLSPDGIFVFEVSYLVDTIEKMLFDTIYHEHLSYHSVKPLKKFFEKHELELTDVKRIPTKGGSIRGIVRHLGKESISKSVFDLLVLKDKLCLDKIDTFKVYAKRIKDIKEALHKILGKYKKDGKTTAGYGSSVTVNTLMHHFELDKYISFIADDNPSKQGRYTPNQRIPIFSPQALYEKKPNYIVILAWNYANQIMEKHKLYSENGGHFIIPLPEIKLY